MPTHVDPAQTQYQTKVVFKFISSTPKNQLFKSYQLHIRLILPAREQPLLQSHQPGSQGPIRKVRPSRVRHHLYGAKNVYNHLLTHKYIDKEKCQEDSDS